MLIQIDEDIFYQVLKVVKSRNTKLYNKIKDIKPLAELNQVDPLANARTIKTQRVKQSIKETIISLYSQDMKPTKYKIHKSTGIAYTTLSKYYDEILDEVLNSEH